MHFELSKECLERFEQALEIRDDAFITGSLEGVIPADITALLSEFEGINPTLASGPFITTAIDLLGLAVYFYVAHLLHNFQ